MPSRKRGKGKARKAKAKAAATNANAASNELGTAQRAASAAAVPTMSSSRQVPTALIPDLNQLMGGLSLAETTCNHGLPPLPPATTARAFLLAVDAIAGKIVKTGSSDYTVRFSKVMDGVFRLGLESALYDLADREALLAGHVALGVAYLTERQEEPNSRSIAAMHAMAVYNLGCPDGSVNEIIANARDLAEGGERTIVKYFAQRITCECLKERFAASKEQPKLGQCSCCRLSKDRSQLLLCSNCNFAQYW